MKTSNQVENNAAKTIALDHLGVIAARIRSNTLKFSHHERDGGGETMNYASLTPLDQVHPHSPYWTKANTFSRSC